MSRCVASEKDSGLGGLERFRPAFRCADEKQPVMDLSRDKNTEEMKQLQLEMGVAKQAHGA